MINLPWAKNSKQESKDNTIILKQKFNRWLRYRIRSYIQKSEKSGLNHTWVYYQDYYDRIFPEVIFKVINELKEHGYTVEEHKLLEALRITWEE